MRGARFLEMANPENDDKDLGMGKALAAPDGDDMSNVNFSANEHDILWIDAVSDSSATNGVDTSDWTQAASIDANGGARNAADQWIAVDDRLTGDDMLFEDGLALTSIDGLPW